MAQIVDTSDFRPGLKIKWEGGMWVILECSHHKMGRGGAIVRGKLRNLKTGASVEQSFKSGERFERIIFDEKPAQYQYHDGDNHVFMDMETYDQVFLRADVLGDAVKYLTDNLEVSFDMYEGRVMGIELPKSVELVIVDTPPGFKGDTASGGGKPATTETGLVVTVPFFIENGEKIVVDARTGEYLERAKKN
jgi:elongation factor P